MLVRLAILAALCLTLPATATSQDAPTIPGVADPSRVSAGTYSVDPAHTLVLWKVSHFGFNPYFGTLGKVEGTLQIDPAKVEEAQIELSLPISSMSVVSEGLREHFFRGGEGDKGPDFFGPDPGEARFVSTRVVRRSERDAYIYGDLTLNGHSRPIAIAATFTGAGINPMNKAETIGFTGRAVIKRSEFGISSFVPLVSDEVELDISAAFEKK